MNTLITTASGSISFSQVDQSGSTNFPPLSSSSQIVYNRYGGLTIVSTNTASERFNVAGNYGNLLTVNDTATGSLFAVNDSSGMPLFTVYENAAVSGTGTMFASGGNSDQWNTAYTNLVNNSAAYLSGFNLTELASASANWNSTYTTVSTNSAGWESAESTVNTNSAGWESAESTVNTNSAGWESAESTVYSNSAGWESAETTLSTNSATWQSTYTNFQQNSGYYDAAVNELFTYVISETGDEIVTEDDLQFASSNIDGHPAWNSTTETVYNLSGSWITTNYLATNNVSVSSLTVNTSNLSGLSAATLHGVVSASSKTATDYVFLIKVNNKYFGIPVFDISF